MIIDQLGWLLYPEPIQPDVQSLTHTVQVTKGYMGAECADNTAFHRSHPVLPCRGHQGRKTGRRQKVSCIYGARLAAHIQHHPCPARAIRPYGALPRSLLITDCRKRARRLAQSKNNNHWKSRAGHDGSLNWEPRLEGEGDGMGDWKISRVFSRNHNLVLIGLVQLGSRLGSDVRFEKSARWETGLATSFHPSQVLFRIPLQQ